MGWYLLAIAILHKPEVSVEGAEKLWYGDDFAKKDVNQEMYELRQKGMKFKEIGEIYGLTEVATFLRIQRLKKAMQAVRYAS